VRAAGVAVACGLAAAPASALADPGQCHVVDVEMTPAADLQIVVWLEDAQGHYIDTAYITRLTGTYGIGNRPGVKDFNSAWRWPYGRREYVFPVWAHRHGLTFPFIGFRNGDEYNLSHPSKPSTIEPFFCKPLEWGEKFWDTQTCATTVRTDKGTFVAGQTSLYPPRADLTMQVDDDPAVATFASLNPFDAVSQATPMGGLDFTTSWPIPPDLPEGDYVMWVEVSKEFDFDDTYNATTYPEVTMPNGSPIEWGVYGLPSRGQPSVVYRVPFVVGTDQTIATASDYVGYGDPEGGTGTLHPPDATIATDTPGSGAARLMLTADASGGTFRVRVSSRPEHDVTPPAAPQQATLVTTDAQSATIDFTEPGDDGLVGPVAGIEVRYRANDPITDANFESSLPVAASITPHGPGTAQTVTIDRLLPETTYSIGVRAYDECKNYGPVAVIEATTTERQPGYVDACFVATAAYGSLLANDVETLRTFRDQYLHTNVLGELAVETYYSAGPALAGVIDESDDLRATTRAALAPVVELVRGR
jgi:hypothetical protein